MVARTGASRSSSTGGFATPADVPLHLATDLRHATGGERTIRIPGNNNHGPLEIVAEYAKPDPATGRQKITAQLTTRLGRRENLAASLARGKFDTAGIVGRGVSAQGISPSV